ncbi:hypothetical protein [Tuberibacillus calidus]|uniref:hypothetical protein n=1 Tax=Tuberibacillus calidus TaxID=340097 RepID=UPI0004114136|nr:hypothetical protein [Tuberibacillus calidus]
MVKANVLSILSLILAAAGFGFSIEFQGMAYLGNSGEKTMQWYWLGAILSYVLCFISIGTLYLKVNKSRLDDLLKIISSVFIIVSFIWTTFIIFAWNSGF